MKNEIISVTWLFNESHYVSMSLSAAVLPPAAFLVPFKFKCTCEAEKGIRASAFAPMSPGAVELIFKKWDHFSVQDNFFKKIKILSQRLCLGGEGEQLQ